MTNPADARFGYPRPTVQNQGIYREAGAAGGLPLPRARLVPFTIVIALLALAAIVMGPMLLVVVGGGMAGAWRLFKEGGWAMWLLLLLDLGAPAIAAGLGAFVLRGRRVPAGLLFVAAGLPLALALLGASMYQRMVMGAISGESVDPEMKARILAEGIAEGMSLDIFGGFVACGVAIVAAAAAGFAVASIDVGTITRGGPRPSSSGTVGATVAGGVWLIATMALAMVRLRAAGPLVLLTILPVAVLVPVAVLAARSAPALRPWHDRAEASRGAAALLVAALSALLAVLALERAIDASFTAKALNAIAGESVDESQRTRILLYALGGVRLAPVAYAVQAVLGIATFGLALVPALGSGRHPATLSAILATAFGLALLVGTLALTQGRHFAPQRALASSDRDAEGVSLPVLVDTFSHRGSGPGNGTAMVVDKNGVGTGNVTSSCDARWTVYADRAATLTMLRTRLGGIPLHGRICSKQLAFVATREHPKDVDARLGYLAGFLGTRAYVPVIMDGNESTSTTPSWGRDSGSPAAMRVVLVADDAVEIDGARLALPLAAPPSAYAARRTRITYVFQPSDTIETVVRTISAVEIAYADRISSYDLERTLDDGTRPPPPPPLPEPTLGGGAGAPASVRNGAVVVNGRLPPEVIQRIVRQNTGRMRLCYENGLRNNPSLRGRVTVKLVIDRSGAVSTASDGGSDLADAGVVACVVRAFGNLSFPAPEGGIVTVVYPLTFTSAD